jgi:hypothetical protein
MEFFWNFLSVEKCQNVTKRELMSKKGSQGFSFFDLLGEHNSLNALQ